MKQLRNKILLNVLKQLFGKTAEHFFFSQFIMVVTALLLAEELHFTAYTKTSHVQAAKTFNLFIFCRISLTSSRKTEVLVVYFDDIWEKENHLVFS